MITNEIDVLRSLRGMIEHDPIQTREEFGDLMKAVFVHGRLETRKLADDLGFNFTTVYRWIEGHNAPHASVWPRISSWISVEIDRRVTECNNLKIPENGILKHLC
ncbi:hypothetical protein [Methylobacterium sp. Leaf102]|uniref:hypothetical protein n=1 Tax=Methylobacterium sp. Leaf102 TaxID=1736253 RepID=UPI0012E97A25|nr:hypothetical protein [Methylobacterium sp. Leaf102]